MQERLKELRRAMNNSIFIADIVSPNVRVKLEELRRATNNSIIHFSDPWKKGEREMCPHNDFAIIYYKGGVMLRRCKDCQQVELHLEWVWADLDDVEAALDFFRSDSENS